MFTTIATHFLLQSFIECLNLQLQLGHPYHIYLCKLYQCLDFFIILILIYRSFKQRQLKSPVWVQVSHHKATAQCHITKNITIHTHTSLTASRTIQHVTYTHRPFNLNGLFAAEGNDLKESQIEGVETEFDRTESVLGGGIEACWLLQMFRLLWLPSTLYGVCTGCPFIFAIASITGMNVNESLNSTFSNNISAMDRDFF